ncbi:1-deoxy-D-xylulose-5-phosphate reductoisomerase [Opitutales bacterium]|nr:1-deoxy-D-xylulose-5-phosphate reductoisomerase [Opitutales bacterium]
MSFPRKLILLGATGSIGKSSLRVIRKHPDKLKLIGISAYQKADELASIAREFGVQKVHLYEPPASQPELPSGSKLSTGAHALTELAGWNEADIVLVAVVGAAGLAPTLAALEAGKDVVLANKESLVVAGELVMETARRTGARILPADSEHNAVFQCLQGQPEKALDSLALTASGGPFRDWPIEDLNKATPEQAMRHPNWDMGPKITVDSATMANKGLELIEAKWLFDLPPEKLHVLIHPPSIVHAIVRFSDGCSFAQMSPPCMTFALQNALLFPERLSGVEQGLDLSSAMELSFSPPDLDRYPCLSLARHSLEQGGCAPLVYNAANEMAVDAFLSNRIGFGEISRMIETTLNLFDHRSVYALEDLLALDQEARSLTEHAISQVA